MGMGQQGQGTSDQASNFFWLIGLIFGAAIALWFFDPQYVVIPFFWLRVHEIDVIRFLAWAWTPIAHLLHIQPPDLQQLDALQQYMVQVDPTHVTWKRFAAINADLGAWSRYPVIFILVFLAWLGYFGRGVLFKTTYNMKTLRNNGQEVWPQITPITSLDLVKEDIAKGPWAMAKLPLEFCRQHELLSVKVVANKKIWVLKQKPCYRLFALQLGPLWKGVDALPIHLKALAVIFMARALGKRPIAKKILFQVARSASTGKLDFSGVSEELASLGHNKILEWAEKRHAYVSTVLARLLEIARSDGVLASAEFLWLKPLDRRMWYVLNSMGRQTSVVEVAGVYAHLKAEKKLGRALKTPFVKGAVDALDEALQNILYVEASDQWRTTSAG